MTGQPIHCQVFVNLLPHYETRHRLLLRGLLMPLLASASLSIAIGQLVLALARVLAALLGHGDRIAHAIVVNLRVRHMVERSL